MTAGDHHGCSPMNRPLAECLDELHPVRLWHAEVQNDGIERLSHRIQELERAAPVLRFVQLVRTGGKGQPRDAADEG